MAWGSFEGFLGGFLGAAGIAVAWYSLSRSSNKSRRLAAPSGSDGIQLAHPLLSKLLTFTYKVLSVNDLVQIAKFNDSHQST
jgi:hypothetical protein